MQNNLDIKTGRVYSAKRPKIIRYPLKDIFITIDKLFILTASLFNTIA